MAATLGCGLAVAIGGDGLHRRDEFDGNAAVVMAGDASGHLADQHHFAQRRTRLGLQRHPAQRQIQHFAGHHFAAGAGEARQPARRLAVMAAQRGFVDQILVEKYRQLFGDALALERRAAKLHAEIAARQAHDIAFEASEIVDIENDRGAGQQLLFGGDPRAARATGPGPDNSPRTGLRAGRRGPANRHPRGDSAGGPPLPAQSPLPDPLPCCALAGLSGPWSDLFLAKL